MAFKCTVNWILFPCKICVWDAVDTHILNYKENKAAGLTPPPLPPPKKKGIAAKVCCLPKNGTKPKLRYPFDKT